MKGLFLSEFQRLWSRKSTLICFLSIPIILFATAKYYLGVNKVVEITNPQFTSFYNFPVAAIQEQLVLAFNGIVVVLIILSLTQEMRNGSIRMVLIRRFKPTEVFKAKMLVIIVTIFMYLVIYMIFSYIIGFIMFPKVDSVSVFYCKGLFNGGDLFIYTLKYYFIAFLTLIAVSSLVFFISAISRSVIIASGFNVLLILMLLAYPTIIQILLFNKMEMAKYQLLSILQVQYQGIAMMLGDNNMFSYFSLGVITLYIVVFGALTYGFYSRKDYLI